MPLDARTVIALKHSALALDAHFFLARRFYGLTRPRSARRDGHRRAAKGIVDHLPAELRAGVVGHGQLRPLRAEGGGDLSALSATSAHRTFVALARVIADVGGGGWPESMVRELQACTTPAERNAWAQRWGRFLSGEAQRDRQYRPPLPPMSSKCL